jgi:hypothetical protein
MINKMKKLYNDQYDVIKADNGTIAFFKKGTLIEAFANKQFLNDMGCLHRLDGPAVVYNFGGLAWYVDGSRLSKEKEKLLNIWYENKSKL